MRNKSSRVYGFTLIEISIVIFIILLMTSAVVPYMKTFAESTRLRSVARGVRNLMEFARNSSISERNEYIVLFDASNGEYWLSLKQFLSEETNGTITDSSRANLAESLTSLSEQNTEGTTSSESTSSESNLTQGSSTSEDSSTGSTSTEENEQKNEGTLTRTGGLLGIPKQLPKGIEIVKMVSPRSTSTGRDVEYIVFHSDSTAEDFEIYLRNFSGRIFLLTVTGTTGRTGIRELRAEEIEGLGLGISDNKKSDSKNNQ